MSLNADPTRLIDWFDDGADLESDPAGTRTNTFRFLSNFYPDEPFELDASLISPLWDFPHPIRFATGEHAFQAAKAVNPIAFEAIAGARTPAGAKAGGRRCTLRSDWEAVKYDVMREVLAAKFAPDTLCADLLELTGNAMLVEGTWWNDRVWGVDLRLPDRPGRNWLGTLLMARRAELRAGA